MELQNNKAVVICAGIGGWYPHGVRRLEKSLNFVGSPFDTLFYTEEIPGYPGHGDFPYYFKIAAFEEAKKKGYRKILWVDSSFWAVRSPMQIFDHISELGFYMFRSGYNLAQSVNDRALNAVGLSRNDAVNAIEYASGCVGINLDNPDGLRLYNQWKTYMDMGLSKGSRSHGGQSKDPRFLHHRQDQSALSLAMWQLGLSNNKDLDFISYFGGGHNIERLIFFIGGL